MHAECVRTRVTGVTGNVNPQLEVYSSSYVTIIYICKMEMVVARDELSLPKELAI